MKRFFQSYPHIVADLKPLVLLDQQLESLGQSAVLTNVFLDITGVTKKKKKELFFLIRYANSF